MREILFRGKGLDGPWNYKEHRNNWVEGYLFSFGEGEFKETYILTELDHRDSLCDIWKCAVKVNPETVGQFTGMLDKNGKRIFEGDIMHSSGNVVEFCNGSFCINGDCPLCIWAKTEVVGNIHDNLWTEEK